MQCLIHDEASANVLQEINQGEVVGGFVGEEDSLP
jgi:hypothetical protein